MSTDKWFALATIFPCSPSGHNFSLLPKHLLYPHCSEDQDLWALTGSAAGTEWLYGPQGRCCLCCKCILRHSTMESPVRGHTYSEDRGLHSSHAWHKDNHEAPLQSREVDQTLYWWFRWFEVLMSEVWMETTPTFTLCKHSPVPDLQVYSTGVLNCTMTIICHLT